MKDGLVTFTLLLVSQEVLLCWIFSMDNIPWIFLQILIKFDKLGRILVTMIKLLSN